MMLKTLWLLMRAFHKPALLKKKGLSSQKGVVVVEYVLLLVVCVSMALVVYKTIDMSPENPGWVISVWKKVLVEIAEDID